MNTICICGAGTMGSGIAQVSAAAGYHTVLYDLNENVLQLAKERIMHDLEQQVRKQKITEHQKDQAFRQIRFTADLHECIADLVIEAVVEKPSVKIGLFNQLAEINHGETIFATNTSSLSVTDLAAGIINPRRVAGLHFFNPAPLMKLVEVVKCRFTDNAVIERLVALTRTLGKEPVVCADAPGFIVNRVARPFYIESLRIVEEETADVETIDRLLEARGFRMGPFKLMDLIGNDINYAVSCSVYEQLQQPARLRPSPIQKSKVDSGQLGKKTRKGYYDYS